MTPSSRSRLVPARFVPALLAPVLVATLALAAGVPAATAAGAASRGPVAVARATSAAAADARIAAELRARLPRSGLGADVSVRVLDPATGATVFASRASAPMLPASNMKLVTAFDALTVMGPSARFPTRVVRGASPGSVVVVGGGDPLLSSGDLSTLASRTLAALRTSTAGHRDPARLVVGVDDSLFPAPTRATGWSAGYGLADISPVRALARHGVASNDTAADAMAYFDSRLRAAGVSVSYVGGVRARAGAAQVAEVAGHTVAADLDVMLQNSDNQIAETLYRQVALHSGRTATWSGAAAAARTVLARAGLPTTGTAFADGSGLSRSDRVTSTLLVALLRKATGGSDPGFASFLTSLPLAGRTGTLAHRFTTAPTRCAASRLRAKTGFINGVVALSGVASAADGRRRVFSILVNGVGLSGSAVTATQQAVDRLAATVTGCY